MTHSRISSTQNLGEHLPEFGGRDEKERRQQALVEHAQVRITSNFYGPDLYNHRGIIRAVDLRLPYPYAVAVQDVPGYPGAVRSFAWYEIDV